VLSKDGPQFTVWLGHRDRDDNICKCHTVGYGFCDDDSCFEDENEDA
jgi:hypothetical protein